MQQWLFELVVGVLATHGLFALVAIGCALAAAATPLLVYALARTSRCGTLAAAVAAFLATGVCFAASAQRAETFAVDFFALELLVLFGALPLWSLFLIVGVWANVHASVLLAVAAPGLVAIVSRLSMGRGTTDARRAAAATAIAAIATFATPYGVRLWTYAWSLAFAKNPAAERLDAWLPLSFTSAGAWTVVLPGVAIFAAVGVVARRRYAGELALAACVFVMTLLHARYLVFLPVAWAVPLARALEMRTLLGRLSRLRPRAPAFALVPFVLWVVVQLFAVHRVPERPGPWQTAAEIIAAHDLRGNTYAEYGWAAYLTYRHLPVRVLIDAHGDPYPAAIWRDVKILEELRPGWDAVLGRYAIANVVVKSDSPLAQILAVRSSWKTVERRDGVAVFARVLDS